MNYCGLEPLRAEIKALAGNMCDTRITLNRLETQYRYEDASLAERMAAQTLRRINALFLEAYREVLVLDDTFQD